MADNPITGLLPQDLPTNWTYGQTIGPTGTDVGLTQQHGYNYLMKQVNAAQQAAQELGNSFSGLYGTGDIVPITSGGTGASNVQNALANLGAGVRPNLGDNCDFINPVNQRGVLSWTAPYGDSNIFDRWTVQGNEGIVSAALNSGGLELSMSATNQGIKKKYATGYLEPGKTYNSSIIVDGQLFSAQIVPDAVSGKVVQYPGAEFSCAITFNEGGCQWYPYVDYRAGSRSVTISCCKLENGAGQTLAYQDESGNLQRLQQPDSKYGQQLLECQRYYQLYSSADSRPEKAVDCRPVMRIDPTQGTVVIDGVTYYYNDATL